MSTQAASAVIALIATWRQVWIAKRASDVCNLVRYKHQMPDETLDLAEIRRRLQESNRSQADLARALKLAPSAVSRMLNGSREIKVREMNAIEGFLAGLDVQKRSVKTAGSSALDRAMASPHAVVREVTQSMFSGDVRQVALSGCSIVLAAAARSSVQALPGLSEEECSKLFTSVTDNPMLALALVLKGVRVINQSGFDIMVELSNIMHTLEETVADEEVLALLRKVSQQPIEGKIHASGPEDPSTLAAYVLTCASFALTLDAGIEAGIGYLNGMAAGIAAD